MYGVYGRIGPLSLRMVGMLKGSNNEEKVKLINIKITPNTFDYGILHHIKKIYSSIKNINVVKAK